MPGLPEPVRHSTLHPSRATPSSPLQSYCLRYAAHIYTMLPTLAPSLVIHVCTNGPIPYMIYLCARPTFRHA